MASLLGQNSVVKVITDWMCCAVLCMAGGDEIVEADASENVKDMMAVFKGKNLLWQQVRASSEYQCQSCVGTNERMVLQALYGTSHQLP